MIILILSVFVVVKEAYEWLITWLVIGTQQKYEFEVSKGANSSTARSKSQVYRAVNLSKAYGEVNKILKNEIKLILYCSLFNRWLYYNTAM